MGSILEWFWDPFSYFFRFQDRSKNQRFFASVFYEFGSILDSKRLPYDGTKVGKSPPRRVQDRLEDAALIFCLSWLRFGTLLGRFWHHFGRFRHPFFVDSGVDVCLFGPFSLTCGIDPFFFSSFRSSLPSYIHVSIFPFILSYILPFIPGSFSPFFPASLHMLIHSSLHPFIHWPLHPSIHWPLHPFMSSSLNLSSILPFIPSSLFSFIAWRIQSRPGGLREAIEQKMVRIDAEFHSE